MLTSGRKLDNRYLVREEIGSGGFGAVYLAEDSRFTGNNLVAIKKMQQTGEQSAKAFRHEANLLYNLTHPNLPKVTNCFQEGEANFIVMDFIAGDDLMSKLRTSKRFSVAEVLEIADKVLDALEYLHSFLIFHRDIKPHNIKIDPHGKIYLLDFGTAKGHLDDTTLSLTDQSITGYTPFYAPLEQVLRVDANSYLLLQSIDSPNLEKFLLNKTDARSDIYSLGATVYHLLTGTSPERAMVTVRAHLVWSGKLDPLPDSQSLNPEISERLAAIIKKCVEIEPENRFQTAAELRSALKNLQFAVSDLEKMTWDFVPVLQTQPELPQTVQLQLNPTQPSIEPLKFEPAEHASPVSVPTLFKKGELPNSKTKSRTGVYIGLLGLVIVLAGIGGWLAWRSFSNSPEQTSAVAGNQSIAVNPRTLSYSLLVQKIRDGRKYQEPFEASGQEIFESSYQFQIRLTAPADGLLYVFGEGLNEQGNKVITLNFPTPLKNDGKANVIGGQKYESGWNVFQGTPGTENYWIIYSRKKNAAVEKARDQAFANRGTIIDSDTITNLKNYLNDARDTKATTSKDAERKITEVSFTGESLVYLIGLEHQ